MIANRPLILNLIKQLLVVFGIYSITRVLFYYFNKSSFQDLPSTEFIALLFYGLRFDAFSICATNSLYILLAILPFNFQKKPIYKKTLFYIFITTNAVAILLNFIDFVYFPYIQKRTTYDVTHLIFGGQTDFIKLLPYFLLDNWYLIIIYATIIFGLIKAYKYFEKCTELNITNIDFKSVFFSTSSFLIITGFTVLGIRGGLQKIPIVLLDAALYTTQKYIPIVINTPFSLIKSAELNQINTLTFYDEFELKKISTQIIPADTGEFKKLNVCVIILESFSKEFTKAGNRISYTPFLDSLISVSNYCNNAFSNGKTSINGIPSIVSSMPTYMDDPYLNSTYANNTLESLPKLLKSKGYHTSFFHGATNGSMNFNSYAMSAGYDTYYGRTEYNNENDYDGQWGIWDEPFLVNMTKELSKMKEPFFATVFTLSSHNPYKVPAKYKGKFPKGKLEIHESVGYADYSLRQFFYEAKKTEWYKNTLFVLSADHTAVSEDAFYNNSVGQYAIPILFYRPNQQPLVLTKTVQQIDIMPTILDILNYDKPYYAFGKSILSPKSNPVVYYNAPYYHLINDSMMYIFNGYKVIEAYKYRNDSLLSKPLQGLYLKEETIVTNYIKALTQSYNNDVIANKTYYKK
jgi:phosphoglycerol transferase MdoB-like AlkP superfamily enzyme